jgi:hypothetical protein
MDSDRSVPSVTLRYFDACPHWRDARDVVVRAIADEGMDVEPQLERVETAEDAERLDFVGSPSILIDDHDLFRSLDDAHGLSCRTFKTPAGLAPVPTYEQLREALASRGAR